MNKFISKILGIWWTVISIYINNIIVTTLWIVSTYTTLFSSPPVPSFVSLAEIVPTAADGTSSNLKKKVTRFSDLRTATKDPIEWRPVIFSVYLIVDAFSNLFPSRVGSLRLRPFLFNRELRGTFYTIKFSNADDILSWVYRWIFSVWNYVNATGVRDHYLHWAIRLG